MNTYEWISLLALWILRSWCATPIKDNYNERLMEAGMVLVSDELNRLQPCSNADLLWMEGGNSVHVIGVLVALLFGWTLSLTLWIVYLLF